MMAVYNTQEVYTSKEKAAIKSQLAKSKPKFAKDGTLNQSSINSPCQERMPIELILLYRKFTKTEDIQIKENLIKQIAAAEFEISKFHYATDLINICKELEPRYVTLKAELSKYEIYTTEYKKLEEEYIKRQQKESKPLSDLIGTKTVFGIIGTIISAVTYFVLTSIRKNKF